MMQLSPTEPQDRDASRSIENTSTERQSLWEASSQYRHWRYSRETLLSQRTRINEAAVSAIRDAFEAQEVGSSEGIQFLNAEDEFALVKLYVSKIGPLCSHFRFDEEVEATAMTYIKRFYLNNTVMDWHPKNVMLTAIFLAAKTTNHPIALEAYVSHIPNTSPNDVLDLEFLLAQSLSFEFTVWHAHRAMWGIWLDLQTLPDLRPDSIKDIYNAAIDHVRTSRMIDAEFIYAPSQIALASLYLASEELAEQWARAKGLNQSSLETIKEAAAMIAKERDDPPLDMTVVKEIDRRLRLCKNPEKMPGTKAYMRRQAAAEAAAAEKRAKKHASEMRADAMEEDVFGAKVINDVHMQGASSPED